MFPFKHRGKSPGDPQGRSAFTLIELLIVVAIIAILAAIAVPNFIQAQVRAKVSRVLNDLRTMRTAIEAYAVDNTSYPRMTWFPDFGDTLRGGANVCEEMFGTLPAGPAKTCAGVLDPRGTGGSVTTPIAYITVLPVDPFVSSPTGAQASLDAYLYTYWDIKTFSSGLNPDTGDGFAYTPGPTGARVFELWLGKYVLWSIGPGGEADFDNPGRRFFLQYDPTNGTISSGSVFVSQKFFSPQWVDDVALEQ